MVRTQNSSILALGMASGMTMAKSVCLSVCLSVHHFWSKLKYLTKFDGFH